MNWANEAGRVCFLELTTFSKPVDDHNLLYLSPLRLYNCVCSVPQEICGSTGGSYVIGEVDRYDYGAETAWELLYVFGSNWPA